MAEVHALEQGETSAVAKAWAHVRGNLRRSAGQRLFDQWLKPIVLVDSSDSDAVRLGLPSAFMTQWVKNHYSDRLLLEFKAVMPSVRSVTLETLADAKRRVIAAVAEEAAAGPAPERRRSTRASPSRASSSMARTASPIMPRR